MRCSMCKESKKHLLVSIFTKELAFSSFLVASDTRLPQILVLEAVLGATYLSILYPKEYVLQIN